MEWIDKGMSKTDMRSVAQRKRDELHANVCGLYRALKAENPGMSNNAVCHEVARRLELTRNGVVRILVKHGAYEPRQKGGAS